MKRRKRVVPLVLIGAVFAVSGVFFHPYWFAGCALALMGMLLIVELPDKW